MPPKLKSVYVCRECGYTQSQWLGKCPSCDQWDVFVEDVVSGSNSKTSVSRASVIDKKPVMLNSVIAPIGERIRTNIGEFDRVLGGGIVDGSLVLLGGEPGIGKSTLLLQVCEQLGNNNQRILYISGEESVAQTQMRAQRLGVKAQNIYVISETNLEVVTNSIAELDPHVIIVDSIQIMYSETLESAPGSVAQVREIANNFMRIAKDTSRAVFLIGHITKEGAIAGPKVLEHMVDTVLYFEGDRYHAYRVLRAVKNRFGPTDEIGVFRMDSEGLQEVSNPSEIFLAERRENISGSVVVTSVEGTRPILVELQALVTPTAYGIPNRKALGVDYNRMMLLLAVLEKRVGLGLSTRDVFINAVGGAKVFEPAIDLGMVLALYSSFKDVNIDQNLIAIGEVGLGGELRSVSHVTMRVKEGIKLGFRKFIVPENDVKKCTGSLDLKDIDMYGARTVKDAIDAAVRSVESKR